MKKLLLMTEVFMAISESPNSPLNEILSKIQELQGLIDNLEDSIPGIEKNPDLVKMNKAWLEFRKSVNSLLKSIKSNSVVSAADAGAKSSPGSDLKPFALEVKNILPHVRVGGGNKEFVGQYMISDVYEALKPSGLSLEEFKKNLVECNRLGLLELQRIDLVAAFDPEVIKKSETKAGYGTATFHAVVGKRTW